MDIVETCPGNTVYLPVFVPGGFLYLGDAHAAMGHGELSATGLEMPAETTITVDLRKGKRLPGPRIESPDEIMTVVSGCPMERSIAQAYAQLILWMEAELRLGPLAGLRPPDPRRPDLGRLLRARHGGGEDRPDVPEAGLKAGGMAARAGHDARMRPMWLAPRTRSCAGPCRW